MLNTKEILARLKNLREEKSLNQEFMAHTIGVDRTTYVRKERGAIPITTEEWLKIARATGKPPSFFFSSNGSGAQRLDTWSKERLLVRLYRSLDTQEKKELIGALNLILKGVGKSAVKDALKWLKKP